MSLKASRAIINTDGSGHFEEGDSLLVYAQNVANGHTKQYILHLENGVWKPEIYWKELGDQVQFTAWHIASMQRLYQASQLSSNYSHSIETDQQGAGYRHSDLLLAKAQVQSGEKVHLNFSHALNRLHIVLESKDHSYTTSQLQQAKISIHTPCVLPFNLANGTLDAPSHYEWITPLKQADNQTWTALLCPQETKALRSEGWIRIQIEGKESIAQVPEILEGKSLDKLEADRRTLRTGMDTAQRKLKQAEQTVAAAEAAVEALTAQQTAAQKELPARSAEELTAQQTELTAARETLRSREKQLSAQLLPNRKTAAQYRAAAEARQALESRWQWVSALAATAGGTLTSKQKIRLEAYIQMNYLDRILRYANTRLMQMTAGQYELERIGAENQRSQSGLDLGVIDHYNGTRRSVKTLSGGESFKASLALALGLSDEVQSAAGGIRLDTLFLDEGFGSLDDESLEQAMRVLAGLTEGDRLVGIISHVGALKDRIDRQVVVRKGRTGGSTVELIV